MSLDKLINLERVKKIRPEKFSTDDLKNKLKSASKFINTAEKVLTTSHFDENDYALAYSGLYDAFRMLCEITLALEGYRPDKGLGHHDITINSIRTTLPDVDMDPVYLRLIKLGRKRNNMEYGGKFDTSESEMEQMLKDVKLVFEKVSDRF